MGAQKNIASNEVVLIVIVILAEMTLKGFEITKLNWKLKVKNEFWKLSRPKRKTNKSKVIINQSNPGTNYWHAHTGK